MLCASASVPLVLASGAADTPRACFEGCGKVLLFALDALVSRSSSKLLVRLSDNRKDFSDCSGRPCSTSCVATLIVYLGRQGYAEISWINKASTGKVLTIMLFAFAVALTACTPCSDCLRDLTSVPCSCSPLAAPRRRLADYATLFVAPKPALICSSRLVPCWCVMRAASKDQNAACFCVS